jgi:tryptophan synthase alpha chain
MQQKISDTIASMTAKIRAHTELPIAVGFGISNPEQAASVAQYADAIVVGSAVVNRIAECGRSPDLVPQTSGFVKSLAQAVKGG